MSEKKRAGRRTTVYRLTGVKTFKRAIRDKYLKRDGFECKVVKVGERDGLLVSGAMQKERADWCSAVSALTTAKIEIEGVTPAGVLLVRPDEGVAADDEVAYALTYGMGFQLLEPGRIDNLFGQRIAIRAADPLSLRSLTVTTMDDRSKTSRATIPSGEGLLGFGVGDIGEAVSRIVASASLPQLSRSNGEPLQIRGADALNVPIGLSPDEVLGDLDELESLLCKDPLPKLKILEQLAIVKNPETKEQLDLQLSEALAGRGGTIGLAWPFERVDENGTPDSWKPSRLYRRRDNRVREGLPSWSDIYAALQEYPEDERLGRVNTAAIQLFGDAEGNVAISQAIPLKKWIAFECLLEGNTYSLYDGSWYQIHTDYAENINAQTERIFAQTIDDLSFPAWDMNEDEDSYNKRLAEQLEGTCLDKKLISTDLHRRGIEACDVYLPDATFIHVKKTENSSAASHLLAQALVSADAICLDSGARQSLKCKIKREGGKVEDSLLKPKRVILAMHRQADKRITADSLFTFTKVNLVRQVNSLEERGVKVYVVDIE
ncbi:hypothetical protein HMPREF2657_08970 [Corynebacterium sp. HMSC072B08]|uniref:DUF6119 family protein n=1 Tax=Corynebacterium sp. HMSC072B08 TaxID=1715136 RepID=UPI0008A90821|nr:DUF6119 family protein [Corynebacterium sp. HMSC072B08]OHQ62342.1 hypothetical protein HMPREF2657_08970 [Corynebacterium sp. HMSC072B08]